MAEELIYEISGTAVKYISLIAGGSAFITSDSPHNYIIAGLFGFLYFGGELLQKTANNKKLDKELKNLEDKLKK